MASSNARSTSQDHPGFTLPPWPGVMPQVEASVAKALRDGDWGKYDGPNGALLVRRLAEYFRQPHVTLCSSGTIGVELALRGLGVTEGREVILGGYDFPGNFRAIEAIGATPVLVDLMADRYALDPERVNDAIGEKTAAILVSHLHGSLAPMHEIVAIARARGIFVLEDACQCPGATIEGERAGGFGDAAVLSFGGSKLLTAGRGGAVLTRDERVHQRMTIYQDRGNLAFPLSELQAAALLPQLDTLHDYHAQRLNAAKQLALLLGEWILSCHGYSYLAKVEERGYSPAYYKFPIVVSASSRERICAAANNAGVPLYPGFRGFTTRSSRRCRMMGELANARRFSNETALLHHSALLIDSARVKSLASFLSTMIEKEVRCTS